MAVVQNPITGRSRGKFSNAVFTKWKGRNVLKSKPLEVANPQTPAQIMRRGMFSTLVAFGRQIRSVIETGFSTFSENETWMNSFIKYNNGVSVTAGTPPLFNVDQAAVVTSQGPLTPTEVSSVANTAGSQTVTVTWPDTVDSPDQTLTDLAFILLQNITQEEFAVSAGAVDRQTGTVDIDLPSNTASSDGLVATMFFQQSQSGDVSDSTADGIIVS